jgi:peptidoglycan/LPS O-acetylase OafA/YrhL
VINLPSNEIDILPMQKSQINKRVHLAFLDGIRALAALWVVFAHTYEFRRGGNFGDGLSSIPARFLLSAHFAVDVFIVLSGFCLTLPFAKKGISSAGAMPFFRRRARRILPPYYAAIIASILILAATGAPLHSLLHPYRTLAANLLLLQDVFWRKDTIDAPLWSVATEWKIYFLFPFLLGLVKRNGLPTMLLAAGLIAYSIVLTTYFFAPDVYRGFCSWYLLLFAIGVYASFQAFGATAKPSSFHTVAGGASVALALWCLGWHFRDTLYYPILDPAAGVLAAMGLVALARVKNPHSRLPIPMTMSILSCRPLVWIGSFSYSLYLTHYTVLEALNSFFLRIHGGIPPPRTSEIIANCVEIPLTVAFAYIFHLIFERPFMTKPAPKTEHQAEVAAVVSPAP